MKYSHVIRHSEAERSFIYVNLAWRSMFPKINEEFILEFKGKEFEVEMDNLYRIWLGRFSKEITLNVGEVFNIIKEDYSEIYRLERSE